MLAVKYEPVGAKKLRQISMDLTHLLIPIVIRTPIKRRRNRPLIPSVGTSDICSLLLPFWIQKVNRDSRLNVDQSIFVFVLAC